MKDRSSKSKGVSFLPEDAVESGLFSSGPATIIESVFANYNYGNSTKPTPVWLITYARDGEDNYEQPYSLGKGWKVSDDGLELIAKAGQTGLAKSCNAMKYLIGPACEALQAADKEPGDFFTGDPSLLEGLTVIVKRVPQEKREGLKSGGKADDKERTILIIEEVTDEKPAKGKAKSKRAADEDEDEDDEKPKRKGKADADEDEADDDEPKAKRKGKASDEDEEEDEADDDEPKAKGKGKAKSKSDDEDEPNELDEEAGEALVAALEAEDGPIKLRDLADVLSDALKGNPQRKAIIARGIETDFLETEVSWTFDGKTIDVKKKSRR